MFSSENNSRVRSIQDKPEGKAEVQKELEEGLEILIQNNIDLIIVEVGRTISKHIVMRHWKGILSHYNMKIESHLNFQYFHNIREMEWAIDLALKYNRPVAATMCIGEA